MTYQSGIPTGSVPLNQDYLNMQNNFSQLATQFAVDHVPLTSTSGTPPNGYHEAIHLVTVSSTSTNPPNNQPINGYTATGGYGQIFNAQINDGINTDEALYFLSGGNKLTQLTRNFAPVIGNPGATFLPGGLILNWGGGAIPTGVTTYTFAQKFGSAAKIFAIIITGQTNSSPTNNVYVVQNSISAGAGMTFQVDNFSTSITAVNWIAIGN